MARSSRGSEEWPGRIASEQHDSLAQGSLAAGEEGSQRSGGARTRSAAAQLVGSLAQPSILRVVRQRTDDVGHAAARGGLRRGRDVIDEVDGSGRRVAPRLRRVGFLQPAESSVARLAGGNRWCVGRTIARRTTRSPTSSRVQQAQSRLSAPSRQHDLRISEATALALGRAMASEELGDPPLFDGRTGPALRRHWAAAGVGGGRAFRWPELYARAEELTQQVLQELAGGTAGETSGSSSRDVQSPPLAATISTCGLRSTDGCQDHGALLLRRRLWTSHHRYKIVARGPKPT